MKQKLNLSAIKQDVFYKYIYPVFPKEFLFGNNYPMYAEFVNACFILSPEQWDEVLEEWENKEKILTGPKF